MKDLNKIGEELFSKLRGRFKNITIGNAEGVVTNTPSESRFYDFVYGNQGGKVSVSLDEEAVVVMYSENLFDSNDASIKRKWYDFLKEMRVFAKKRMLNFEVRDIQKSNLEKRDYKFLSNKNGDNTMTESTMYGTSKTSYQNIADARICVKHSESINQELAGGRSQKIGSIYIESANGERFKYPFKHLNGARAMARHVAEAGNMYDDFGKHIVGLSEEMNKLRKFKTYMSRSSVMAEGLAGYMDVVNERIETVKNTVAKLQNKAHYTEATSNFQSVVLEEVPEDVATDWTTQLTIKQFNEELKGVFPYIYKLVSEANAIKELGPEELLGEADKDKQDNGTDKMDVTDADKKANTPAYKRMKAGDKRYNDKTTKENVNESDFDRDSVTYDEVLPFVKMTYKTLLNDIQKTRKEIEQYKANGDDGEEGGDIAMVAPYLKDLKDMQPYVQKILDNPDMDIETVADHMMPGALDTSPREDLIGRFKKSFSKDPQLAKRLFKDPDLDFHSEDDESTIPTEADIDAGFEEMMGQFSEKAKPDFLDMDGDGDKEEPMKKAIDDKEDGDEDETDEGNAYAHAVRKAKMDGKKKGDKIDHPDDDEEDITLEKDQNIPLPEKILSLFDREEGTFPKGETAVLTMVEKDYGEQYIAPAKQFIEKILSKYESVMQGPAVQEMEAEHEPEKITLAVTADIEAMKRAAGIGESERPASNTKLDVSQNDLYKLAGL